MDVAYVSAISALAGSLIGGMTSILSTWINQREQTRAARVAHDLTKREDLVKDFIVTASKAYGHALVSNEPELSELVELYAMISRMRVLSMTQSVAHAERIMHATVSADRLPNQSLDELHEATQKGFSGFDPLAEFSLVAREELARIGVRIRRTK